MARKFFADILRAAIRMDDRTSLDRTADNCFGQRLNDQLISHRISHRPTNNAFAEFVLPRSQVTPSPNSRRQVRDVANNHLARSLWRVPGLK